MILSLTWLISVKWQWSKPRTISFHRHLFVLFEVSLGKDLPLNPCGNGGNISPCSLEMSWSLQLTSRVVNNTVCLCMYVCYAYTCTCVVCTCMCLCVCAGRYVCGVPACVYVVCECVHVCICIGGAVRALELRRKIAVKSLSYRLRRGLLQRDCQEAN